MKKTNDNERDTEYWISMKMIELMNLDELSTKFLEASRTRP